MGNYLDFGHKMAHRGNTGSRRGKRRTGKTGERLGADGKRQEMDTAYSYDLLNHLKEERRGQEGERYAYDPAGNRLRKQSCHYALTAAENRGSHPAGKAAGTSYINGPVINPADDCVIDGEETYCYNERNQLTERRNRSVITKYLYDENGSLVREKEGSRTASYKYDLLNRQTHVRLPDGREKESRYDGEGLRAGLKENGKETTFLFLEGEILAECKGDGMPVRRHLSGLGLSHVQTLSDGVYHTYHQDEQGSTAYITGNEGTVENSYIYDAFGKVLESRENIKNRILYTGQQYDQETGQYYLRARYYNPVTGRFTQEDTYRGDGLNLYAYCGNNPVIYYDPSGHGECKQGNQNKTGETPSDSTIEEGLDALSKPSSKELRQNMIDAGIEEPDYPNAAHHKVAGSSPKADEARAILQKFGIDINDSENGVFLPTIKDVSEALYHPCLHTNEYYDKVNELLRDATSKKDVLFILDDIGEQLLSGSFMK